MLVELANCEFGYASGRPVVRVEGAVRVVRGTCLGVFGPNGAGKTTLVRGLLGLIEPMSGAVHRERDARRGYLPQHRGIDPSWPMSARDAATLATSARRRFGWAVGCAPKVTRATETLEVADLAQKSFAKLSGGQQQRVLLAGALADEPDLLVLDEPTDGLDVASRNLLIRVLRDAFRHGVGGVVVSHVADDIVPLCESALWLEPAREPGAPSTARLIPASAVRERLLAGHGT